ncbi:MAG: ABC-F family ATP-binding cassette domain-containing protein [Bacteroidetes bacterium]|jgi:ABC transport system ATP-binding/permease protein|nr:ABC-F family ATP-binding cassette domain-containing protein [Bacteroidota bacterium]MBT4339318.1 ABC-F family ATP-binding cassette domain-containing protein [Bacteroidota bacterium]MBT5992081.1 ABC-F family ATP-binding cassette domain-containing protein [Bacteroidota bacterium]MBT7039371.1 ABC-F family ATP-binding cassette domain-containing protein [Bacteroidota bacterium]
MNYISAENLFVQFGDQPLFEDLSFGLDKGDKIALIASNGKGKSTLLNIIAGKDVQNDGKLTVRDGIKIGFLEQEPIFNEQISIKELIREANSDTLRIIREYEIAAENQANDFNSKTHEEFEKASHAMDNAQAWDYERRLKQVLSKFNINELGQKIGNLSGGQKKRLALSLVLLDSPDVLLLDEPTNHLDVEMVEWLEKHLSQSSITFFMVTHDRYFLDNVCTHIIEMEDEKIYHHKGNYSFYLKKKEEREIQIVTEIAKAGKQAKKELEWMRTMPKARTTKSKSRIDAFYEIEKKAKSGKIKKEIKLDAKMSRLGGKILELKNVDKSYGDLVILKSFEYTFRKGDRLGIVGKNGVGKSTFLNIITGKEKVDIGEINPGETIVYGYYTQGGLQFDEEKKVLDIVRDEAEVFLLASGNTISASQFLEHFMFPPKVQQTPVSKLSGGEKRRLYLLTVLIKNPNFLIFDEPTNDLDLETLQKLEEFLANFPGCLIVVSHDRYFMDKLTDHLFIFKGDGVVTDYHGSYTSWRQKQIKTDKAQKAKDKATTQKQESTEKKKLTYKEKLEYQQLEKDIDQLELEKKTLEADMESYASDAEKTVELVERYGVVEKELDEKSNRWLELAELDN